MASAKDKPSKKSNEPRSEYITGISGLTPIGKNTFLVVHDESKPGRPRAGIYKAGKEQVEYQSIEITHQPTGSLPLSDVECIVAVPGRSSEFFLLESGAMPDEGPRRRILAQVVLEIKPMRALRVIGWTDIWSQTSDMDNIEGMVCWKQDGKYMLLISDRGESKNGDGPLRFAYAIGQVRPVDSNVNAGTETLRFNLATTKKDDSAHWIELPLPSGKDWRACTDIFLDDQSVLWGACAVDPGKKGPFQSMIYRIGTLDRSQYTVHCRNVEVVFRCDGVKVEALASHHKGASRMCYATDDERLGSIVRSLPDPPASHPVGH